MLEIMEKFGWDYYTYQSQPTWVISLIIEKINVANKLRAAAAPSIT